MTPTGHNAILDEAGWVDTDGDGIRDKDGEPLWLEHWTLATVPAFAGMSTVIESYAAEVGIKFNLNLATRAGYFDAVRAGEHHTQHWWDTGLGPRYGHRARSTTPPTPMAARTATVIAMRRWTR